jgi:hypothetical protein
MSNYCQYYLKVLLTGTALNPRSLNSPERDPLIGEDLLPSAGSCINSPDLTPPTAATPPPSAGGDGMKDCGGASVGGGKGFKRHSLPRRFGLTPATGVSSPGAAAAGAATVGAASGECAKLEAGHCSTAAASLGLADLEQGGEAST